MVFAGLSWWAVIVAAVAGFVVGGIWYGVLGKKWMAAADLDEARMKESGPAFVPMVLAGVGNLVMAYVLAGMIGHLGEITIRTGLISAVIIWVGFIVTTQVVNYSFQMRKPSLMLIDSGHWLLVLLVQGGVIGWFGT